MGHQIIFHALQEDTEAFFRFLEAKRHVVATAWTSDYPEIIRCKSPALEKGALAIWEALPETQPRRKRIARQDGSVVFEVDRENAVLEFSPGALVTRDGLPALIQGRLYSFLKDMGVDTTSLFRAASQWIRRTFEPCPYKLLGGFVGPEAMRWHRDGGVMLPMFNPPATQAWEEFIKSQYRPQSIS
jgi:hypothetical protein